MRLEPPAVWSAQGVGRGRRPRVTCLTRRRHRGIAREVCRRVDHVVAGRPVSPHPLSFGRRVSLDERGRRRGRRHRWRVDEESAKDCVRTGRSIIGNRDQNVAAHRPVEVDAGVKRRDRLGIQDRPRVGVAQGHALTPTAVVPIEEIELQCVRLSIGQFDIHRKARVREPARRDAAGAAGGLERAGGRSWSPPTCSLSDPQATPWHSSGGSPSS